MHPNIHTSQIRPDVIGPDKVQKITISSSRPCIQQQRSCSIRWLLNLCKKYWLVSERLAISPSGLCLNAVHVVKGAKWPYWSGGGGRTALMFPAASHHKGRVGVMSPFSGDVRRWLFYVTMKDDELWFRRFCCRRTMRVYLLEPRQPEGLRDSEGDPMVWKSRTCANKHKDIHRLYLASTEATLRLAWVSSLSAGFGKHRSSPLGVVPPHHHSRRPV